jgi:ATP-dependent DNA helicase RecQ
MEVRTRELNAMMAYGRLGLGCLMASLRRALGDVDVADCGRCSVCRGQRSHVDLDASMDRAQAWLARRPCPIPATSRPEMSEGLSLLDGELGGPLFGGFMSQRSAPTGAGGLPAELLGLLREAALALSARYRFRGVVAVPSRSWCQRDEVLGFLAETLGVPADAGLLVWGEEPPVRQGELWNNDQRRKNVDGRMRLGPSTTPPDGDLLLLDDYIGSGATLKEVCRVLRKQARHRGALVPLTVARVRFRLGARGMPA